MNPKLAQYSFQMIYLLEFELKEQIKYVNNTFMKMLDHPVISIRNKSLEAIKVNLTNYLKTESDNCSYGELLIDWVKTRLVVSLI